MAKNHKETVNCNKIVGVESEDAYAEEVVTVDAVSVEYSQPRDCCEPSDGPPQLLKLTTQNNGVARFITMETERWAVDRFNLEELKYIFDDFCKRSNLQRRENL